MIFENVNVPVMVAVVSALGALAIGLINILGSRGTNRAEAASVITDAALKLLEEQRVRTRTLESRLDVATNRISSLEHNEQMNQQRMQAMEQKHVRNREEDAARIEELLKGIEILINQIVRHDSRPDWTPDSGAKDK